MGPSPALPVDSGEQADDALIQQVLAGNTALFELLMRRYNERVYRAARSIVRDEHETEDVMQQVYVNAFTHLPPVHRRGPVLHVADENRHQRGARACPPPGQARRRFDEDVSNVEPFMTSPPGRRP